MKNEVVSVRFSLRALVKLFMRLTYALPFHPFSFDVKLSDCEFLNFHSSTQRLSASHYQLPTNGTPPSRMTLQLILPADDNGLYESLQYKKSSRPASRTGSYLESKSPGFINTRLVNYNRPLSHQPSLRSVRSQQQFGSVESNHNVPPPSTEEEKSKFTR